MKTCLDGNGNDTTAALTDYLKSRQPLWTAELYQIQPWISGAPFSEILRITDWSGPLVWSFAGTFDKAVIKHSPISSKIGLEADEITVDWSPGDRVVVAANAGNSPVVPLEDTVQAFDEGLYDHGILRIWRTYMPTPGDSNTFGAVHMWEGRIGEPVHDALGIHINAASVLEVLNRKIPPNLIERNNVNAAWVKPPNSSACVALQGSSKTKIYFQVQGTPGLLFAPGAFRRGHIDFNLGPGTGTGRPGELFGRKRAIYDSYVENGQNVLIIMPELPFPPNINSINYGYADGEQFTAYPPHPQSILSNDPAQTGYPQCQPFIALPRPEDSI